VTMLIGVAKCIIFTLASIFRVKILNTIIRTTVTVLNAFNIIFFAPHRTLTRVGVAFVIVYHLRRAFLGSVHRVDSEIDECCMNRNDRERLEQSIAFVNF